MDRSVTLRVPNNLSLAHELRSMVTSVLFRYPEEIKEAASMVASELVENAIKYGESLPHMMAPSFSMSCQKDDISIEVKSGTKSANNVDHVKECIHKISSSENIQELFLARLCALMDNRPQVGQLGLYRICCEGHFQLSVEYADEILSVKARRGLQ